MDKSTDETGRVSVPELDGVKPEDFSNWETIPEEIARDPDHPLRKNWSIKSTLTKNSIPADLPTVYLLDKPNSVIWDLSPSVWSLKNGVTVRTSPEKSQEVTLVGVMVDVWRGGTLEQQLTLTMFDKRVYTAVCSLYCAGFHSMSYSMIYRAMGGHSSPTESQSERIENALNKLYSVIEINNSIELYGETYSTSYDTNSGQQGEEQWKDSILPHTECTVVLQNGKPAKGIFVPYTPILLEWAIRRGQFQVFNHSKPFNTPLNWTDDNLRLEDYCLQRIAQHEREGNKILMSTLFDRCHVEPTNYKKRERTTATLERLFNSYQDNSVITGFRWGKNKTSITFEMETTERDTAKGKKRGKKKSKRKTV